MNLFKRTKEPRDIRSLIIKAFTNNTIKFFSVDGKIVLLTNKKDTPTTALLTSNNWVIQDQTINTGLYNDVIEQPDQWPHPLQGDVTYSLPTNTYIEQQLPGYILVASLSVSNSTSGGKKRKTKIKKLKNIKKRRRHTKRRR